MLTRPEPSAPDGRRSTRVEVVPAAGIVAQVSASLPLSVTLTVTCLPAHGVRKTLDTAIDLARLGYTVVPHLAARRIDGAAELREHLTRLDAAGIESLFVIGGDGDSTADGFNSGEELLRSIRALTGDRFILGVAGYPEGHPAMTIETALEVLARKQALADFVVTQMCFDETPLIDYLGRLPVAGCRRPGSPSPYGWGSRRIRLTRLLAIAARIGVGPSLSFVRKTDARRLISAGHFDPDQFRSRLTNAAEKAEVSFEGFHLYSFNDFDAQRPR